MAHLFGVKGSLLTSSIKIFGSVGSYWIINKGKMAIYVVANVIDNVTSDVVLETANSWSRNGFAVYGRDWFDDYRLVKNTSGSDRRYGATDSELQSVYPSVLDIYRVGAKNIAAQKK